MMRSIEILAGQKKEKTKACRKNAAVFERGEKTLVFGVILVCRRCEDDGK